MHPNVLKNKQNSSLNTKYRSYPSHSTTTCKQRNNTSFKLKPTTLTFCSCKCFACAPDSFLPCSRCPVVPGQLRNKAERQSSKHPPFAEPTHARFWGRARMQAPTTRNYVLEVPTYGVITRVNPIQVQFRKQ